MSGVFSSSVQSGCGKHGIPNVSLSLQSGDHTGIIPPQPRMHVDTTDNPAFLSQAHSSSTCSEAKSAKRTRRGGKKYQARKQRHECSKEESNPLSQEIECVIPKVQHCTQKMSPICKDAKTVQFKCPKQEMSPRREDQNKNRRKKIDRSKRAEVRGFGKEVRSNDVGFVHSIPVISVSDYESIAENCIVVTGQTFDRRVSLVPTSSFATVTCGEMLLEINPWWGFSSATMCLTCDELKRLKFVAIVSEVNDLRHIEGLHFFALDGKSQTSDNGYGILMLTVYNSDFASMSQNCWEDTIKTMKTVKRNIVLAKGKGHFGSKGKTFGIGLRRNYEAKHSDLHLLFGAYKNQQANVDEAILDMCENAVTGEINHAMSMFDENLKGFTRGCTAVIKALLDNGRVFPSIREIMRPLQGNKTDFSAFMSAYMNIGAETESLHTEKDCSYTVIHSPMKAADTQDTRFEFSLQNEEGECANYSLQIKLDKGISICYSAFLITHRQKIFSGTNFMNLSAYANRQVYHDCSLTIRRYIYSHHIVHLPLSKARLFTEVPIQLLENLQLQAECFFRKETSRIPNSPIIKSASMYKQDFFIGNKGKICQANNTTLKQGYWYMLTDLLSICLPIGSVVYETDVVGVFMKSNSSVAGEQQLHWDYNVDNFEQRCSKDFPWFAILPLSEDGSYLYISPAGDGTDTVCFHIKYGCILYLRGDVLHAGGHPQTSGVKMECLRAHFYIPVQKGDVDSSRVWLF